MVYELLNDDHMINSSEYLESLQNSLKIDDANKNDVGLEAVSKGIVRCSLNGRKVELHDVLYVKNLRHNLLSVSKIR